MSKSKDARESTPPTRDSTATASPTPKRASLLGLPRELRDEIWTWTTAVEDPWPMDDPGATEAPEAPSAILQTSQQTRHEASKIYYKATTFEFESPSRCKKWLECFASMVEVEAVRIRILAWVNLSRTGESRVGMDSAIEGRGSYVRELNALEAVVRDSDVQARFEIMAFTRRAAEVAAPVG